jgi:hypothetical protein
MRMYNLNMSWSFRTLVLSVAALWVIAPQLACFMPEPASMSKMPCCKMMSHDCSGAKMSKDCCRTLGASDVGVVAKDTRVKPPEMAEAVLPKVELAPVRASSGILWVPNTHDPPQHADASPLVLRI